MKKCEFCCNDLADDAKFCTTCGGRVREGRPSAPIAPAEPVIEEHYHYESEPIKEKSTNKVAVVPIVFGALALVSTLSIITMFIDNTGFISSVSSIALVRIAFSIVAICVGASQRKRGYQGALIGILMGIAALAITVVAFIVMTAMWASIISTIFG